MSCRECRPLRQEVTRLRRELALLRAHHGALKKENEHLRHRLAIHENPNTPPSARSTSPGWQGGPPARSTKSPGKRKRPGAKPGHPGVTRPPLVPDEEVALPPLERCPQGEDHRLESRWTEDQFQIELPPPTHARVILYHIPVFYCLDCGTEVKPPIPGASWRPGYGPQLKVEIVEANVRDRLPLRLLRRRLMRYGLKVSIRTLETLLLGASDQLKGEYEAIIQRIRKAKVVYADETGFRVAVPGKKWWLWVFTTVEGDVLLVMRPSRGEDVVREILGDEFPGRVVVCDGWKSYPPIGALLQRCWAHLIRKAREASKRNPKDRRARELFRDLSKLYDWAKKKWAIPRGAPERVELKREAERRLQSLVSRYEGSRSSVVQGIVTYVKNGEPWWFTFLEHKGVEPTNNRAERALREAVVRRKIIGILRSKQGAEAFARLMSTVHTWQTKGHDVHEELLSALQ